MRRRKLLFRLVFIALPLCVVVLGFGGWLWISHSQRWLDSRALGLIEEERSDEALPFAIKAERKYAASPSKRPADYATILKCLGMIYDNRSNYPEAEKWYLKAIEYEAKGPANPTFAATLHHDLSLVYRRQKNIEAAAKELGLAVDLLKKAHPDTYTKDPAYASCLVVRGYLYADKRDWEQAAETLREAQELLQSNGMARTDGYADCVAALAKVEDGRESLVKAAALYEEALATLEAAGHKSSLQYAWTMNNLARDQAYIGALDLSKSSFRQALAILDGMGLDESYEYARMLVNMGVILDGSGDHEAGQKVYEEAIGIVEKVCGKEDPLYVKATRWLNESRQKAPKEKRSVSQTEAPSP